MNNFFIYIPQPSKKDVSLRDILKTRQLIYFNLEHLSMMSIQSAQTNSENSQIKDVSKRND